MFAMLFLLIVVRADPKPVRDDATPPKITLMSLEIKQQADTKDWTFDYQFGEEPNYIFGMRVMNPSIFILDYVEGAKPSPDLSVKPSGKKGLTVMIKAERGPADPLLRSVKLVKKPDWVTYEVTFSAKPTDADLDRVKVIFTDLCPLHLVFEGKEGERWTFDVHSERLKTDEKMAKFWYVPRKLDPD
jgi:hypothetical protein